MAVTAFSSSWPRTSGRATSTPAGSCARSRCCTVSTGTPADVHQVNAVEFVAACKNDLRRIDIHHRDVAAEYFAYANRLENALDREHLLSVRGVHRQRVSDLQSVPLGEGARQHQRLAAAPNRPADRPFVSATRSNSIVAQPLIASRVHSENEQVALIGKPGVRDALRSPARPVPRPESCAPYQVLSRKIPPRRR